MANISVLYPTITHNGVSSIPPGGTPQPARVFTDSAWDFTGPQIYRIMAEDGSFKDYEVSIHASGSGAKIITGFVFKSVPVGGGKMVSVVGQINQDTHEIVVNVPHTATTLALAPTITCLGKSLGYSSSSTGDPALIDTNTRTAGQSGTWTDTARNFGGVRFYSWYGDGVVQPVSTTQNTLVIKTAGFPPGRYQVTVSATRSSGSKHYTHVVYFLVRE
jgi:hypothetical protein